MNNTTDSVLTPFTQNILDSVERQNIQMVSFDIFDTLVHRKTARPVDVFALAFEQIQHQYPLAMTAAEYRELRQSTEMRVKRGAVSGEVGLNDIISALPFNADIKRSLLDAELAAESACGFLNQAICQLIATLVNNGVKVVLISDMYLSAEHIRRCFFAASETLQQLPLYVSCELQCNKATGKLYQHVQRVEQINPRHWLHIGDHPVSDGEMADKAGIHCALLRGALNEADIVKQEITLFTSDQHFNAARLISTAHYHHNRSAAFDIGSFVWGPILFAFADWVIGQALKTQSRGILCLMREAEVFAPIIEWRLAQRDIHSVRVEKLYASRKSTFWPGIDVSQPDWFEDLIYVLVQRRGYTVADFYRDFRLSADGLLTRYAGVAIRDTDGLFEQGENLLKLLTSNARSNKSVVQDYIGEQRARFTRYYQTHIKMGLDECVTVDLGNGGTIPHQIEAIMQTSSKANLLFYSSERIYRYADKTHYSSFVSAHSDSRNLRQLLSRSPECIEPFLVGDCGTVTGYSDDEMATPEQASSLPENSAYVQDFLAGLKCYFEVHHQYQLAAIDVQDVLPLLYRYIQLPTRTEALLFTHILHQDNFGSNDAYPIITQAQGDEVSHWPVAEFYQAFCQYPKIKVGKIHWPQAVITLLDDKYLSRQNGLLSMDTDADVLNLMERVLAQQWQRFAVYGAGLFFEKLLPHLQKHNLHIEQVIDRKAEISGPYQVAGFEVQSLQSALQNGCDKILISSFAFKDEIARNIYEQSQLQSQGQSKGAIDILSL
ncbi:HAD family hydrolase [Alteromonas lipolytica]|uniref:Haloacid dehalogenase n=1 Tax=Alteromonas lipolytica TaxID=1856405 RepID=A0A1E8FG73_9ALTE|nr:hypothetical protein [Alteromonas lipolytica]OFI34588.1 hypothetical protein BFC17_13395 [Alteromonas lipolytica]GGF52301.1 hypothetical protein GCM10011338_00530 [Alteromonas lipolytica]